jgi:NADH-quinone oxidoreductase subunit J
VIELIVFAVAGLACLAGAVGVVASSNPVHAALSLVGTLFGIAVLFVAQLANFLAAVQVIVYAGAIVVLFLFVIMLLGVDRVEDLRVEPLGGGQRVTAAVVAAGVLGLVLTALASTGWDATGAVGQLDESVPDINQLGEALFTRYLYAFEITSLLLVIAVVGAVLLSRRVRGEEEIVDPGQAERQAEVTDRIARAEARAVHTDGADDGADEDVEREPTPVEEVRS